MRSKIIQIGNSKGIRLSKELLLKYGLTDQVEIIEEEDSIRLKAVKEVRYGWSEKFSSSNSTLEIEDIFEDEVFEDWE